MGPSKPPPPPGNPPIAIVPYYLYLYVPPIQVMPTHCNAPCPSQKTKGARGGLHFLKFSGT